jgi:hypothetical protein
MTASSMSDEKKKAALARFFELQSRGLIEHDWSEAAETGLVKIKYKFHIVEVLKQPDE